jgi:hypothetical protein
MSGNDWAAGNKPRSPHRATCRRRDQTAVELIILGPEEHRLATIAALGDMMRPLKFLLLMQDDLDQHLLHAGLECRQADLAVALHSATAGELPLAAIIALSTARQRS